MKVCTVSSGDLTSCTSANSPNAPLSGIYINAAETVAYMVDIVANMYRCTIKADGTFDVCQQGDPSGVSASVDILVGGGGA